MLVDDLHWLAKGGRLSNGAAVLGTLLNIKPVLTFSTEGKVEVFEKVRTVKKNDEPDEGTFVKRCQRSFGLQSLCYSY